MEINLKRRQLIIANGDILEGVSTGELMMELYKRYDENIDRFVAEYTIASYYLSRKKGKYLHSPTVLGSDSGLEKFEELLSKLEKETPQE